MYCQNWAVHVTIGWDNILPHMSTLLYRDEVRGYIKIDYYRREDRVTKTLIAEGNKVMDYTIGTARLVVPQRRVFWNEKYIYPLTIINDRVAHEVINVNIFHNIMPHLEECFLTDQLVGQVSVLEPRYPMIYV